MRSQPRVIKSDAEWQHELSPDQFRITRRHGTEAPFTGPWLDNKEAGTYRCICCGNALFESAAKYDSGSGWPSFTRPGDAAAVSEHRDNSLGMERVEIRCADCDAHLGHVFPDGPPPTGLRYCINGTALDFEPES